MNWSQYQLDIFDVAVNTDSNIFIDAVAGSGKTTTIVELNNRVDGNNLFVAFNKHIVESLLPKMRNGTTCKTTHAIGLSLLTNSFGKCTLDNKKVFNIAKNMIDGHKNVNKYGAYAVASFISQAVEKHQSTLSAIETIEDFKNMLRKYDMFKIYAEALDNFSCSKIVAGVLLYEFVVSVAQATIREFKESKVLSFTEMIYLPYEFELKGNYDVVFVDEAQDLNAAQVSLVLSLGNRIIAVGDKFQAIMGFSGALVDSYEQIIAKTDATVLPLSVCYRCPSTHINLAKKLVPHINCFDDTREGEVQIVSTKYLLDNVMKDDLIICRSNAPLVKLALHFISNGIPAKVRGRDFTSQLVKLCKSIEKIRIESNVTEWSTLFIQKLQRYEMQKSAMLVADDAQDELERMKDSLACIRTVVLENTPDSVSEIETYFNDIFADGASCIYLSSIHRAKGLEAKNVYVVKPERMRIQYKGQKEESLKQEYNVQYVGLTRAKAGLFFVSENKDADILDMLAI